MLMSLLWKLSRKKQGFSRWLYDEAAAYVKYYEDFGYDFASNGESLVIDRLARADMRVLFDVGANVGDWSAMAYRAFPQSTVHAFELSERTRVHLARAREGRPVVVAACALGASDAVIEYKDYGESSTLNTFVGSTFHDAHRRFDLRSARVTTGDAYMAANAIDRIDLLKIDVEGAEYPVLGGFGEALAQKRIRVIQFEYGYANGDEGHLMMDFHALLTRAGYVVGKIWTAGVRFDDFRYEMNNFLSGPNYLAVASDETDLIEALRSPV